MKIFAVGDMSLQPHYKIRKLIRIIGVLLVILAIFAVTSSIASADLFPKKCNCGAVVDANGDAVEHKKGQDYPCQESWSGLQNFVFGVEKLLLRTSALNSKTYFIVDINSAPFNSVWGAMINIYNLTLPVGYAMIVMYFIMEIISNSTRDNFNVEQLVKMLIKLFTAFLLLSNGLQLLEGAIDLGNGLVDMFVPNWNDDGQANITLAAKYAQIRDMGWADLIGSILNILMPYVFTICSTTVMFFMIYSRYLEVAARAVFAPIGMANIYEGGLNSSGMRYFKKFVSACLQGAIMCGIFLAGNLLSTAFSSFFTANEMGAIIIELCICGALVKSKSIANDIMGVS